jgi:hypothetical protein
MRSEELQAQFDGIKKLVDLKSENPGLELKHIMMLIETMITNRRGNILMESPEGETSSESIELPTTQTLNRIPPTKEVKKSRSGLKKEDYGMQYELIGKSANEWYKGSAQYEDNPYGVKIGVFERCFKCKLVAIAKMTTQVENDANKTVVYKTYSHHNGSGHYQPLESFKGILSWNDIVKIKEKKK